MRAITIFRFRNDGQMHTLICRPVQTCSGWQVECHWIGRNVGGYRPQKYGYCSRESAIKFIRNMNLSMYLSGFSYHPLWPDVVYESDDINAISIGEPVLASYDPHAIAVD